MMSSRAFFNFLHSMGLFALVVAAVFMALGCPQDDDDDDDDSVPEDADGDGYTAEVDCDDHDDSIHPGADDPCDGTDQDCDLLDGVDGDEDGWSDCDGDCNDGDAEVHPAAVETNNGIDDDCDDEIDEVDEVDLPCDNAEAEPNDDADSANTFGTDDEICGLIDPAGDQDWFAMEVTAWTMVDLTITAASEGSAMMSQVAVYGPDGEDPMACSTGGGDCELSVLFAHSLTYQVAVWDLDPDAGGWEHFYTMSSSSSVPCDVIEGEENGDPASADAFGPDENMCAHVESDADYDYFTFVALGGETWTFDLDAYTVGSSLNAQLALLDEDGVTELAIDEPYWPDDPALTYTFDHPGTYYLLVESDLYGVNDRGAYILRAED